MKIKITDETGAVKYYAGKDKDGKILFAYGEGGAKEYSPRAKGSLNSVVNEIESKYGVECEYV